MTFSITPLTQEECDAKASEEVTKLTKSCSSESGGVSFPLKIVGPKEWNDTLTFLQTTEHKCHITITSDEITVFGPQQYQVAIIKLLQSTKINTDFTDKQRKEERPGKDCTRIDTKRLTEEVDKKPRGADARKVEKKEETCPVCMDVFTKKIELKGCKHELCEDCLERAVKSMGAMCPVCKEVFGVMEGDQPDGTMTWHKNYTSLPGFGFSGTIEIHYNIPGGIQTGKHPYPGKWYHGAQITAYLPDNKEGNEVLMLFKKAFDQKLIFTVGPSGTSGAENTVKWNDIHHKTSMHGGQQNFGYPDPDYLRRVKDELKAKGVK
uniref:E3 ubiquitin-protein ligase n=1 Tax=Neogobius melanostomus TaxID=47308 RepID=A0A8C6SET5_9GOBI